MVTFDKGARVARLDPGTVLDARQVGILLAQLDGTKRKGRLVEWDRAHDPGATKRIDDLVAAKGPEAKTTLMIALSMGVLRTFEVEDTDADTTVRITGDRGKGYTVQPA